jgi:hypothetical protein
MNWLFRRAQAYRIVFLQAGDKPAGPWARFVSWLRPPFGVPTPPGQDVLADLAWRGNLFSPTTRYKNDGSIDPIASAKMEGKRELVLQILKYLHVDPLTLIDHSEEPHD